MVCGVEIRVPYLGSLLGVAPITASITPEPSRELPFWYYLAKLSLGRWTASRLVNFSIGQDFTFRPGLAEGLLGKVCYLEGWRNLVAHIHRRYEPSIGLFKLLLINLTVRISVYTNSGPGDDKKRE